MWSDRVERIVTCMDTLASIRSTFGKKYPVDLTMVIQVGELDQLEELHRLLWNWKEEKQ
jgi:hypothetical protein